MALRLIFGLGNPGSAYERTPHNLGFAALEELARRHRITWKKDARGPSLTAALPSPDAGSVHLVQPLTYMNLSGHAVRAWADWLKVLPAELLIVCDDVRLPWGSLRFRTQGGSGGHNGLASVEQALGTQQYPRLRLGCGPVPENLSMEHFVLKKLAANQMQQYEELVQRATDAIECCQTAGIEVAMNRFNAPASASED